METKTTNRLARETSPYLALHASDPVDWRPWGKPAFEAAAREDRPIYLSAGYASCHWCHVMHRESFRDPDIARTLNERFVPVKVDREERPDVDAVYLAYLTAATGSGGWPMNVFLTPSLLPFFGGTYFPRRAPRHAEGHVPSFPQVLADVDATWHGDRVRAETAAASALGFLSEANRPGPPEAIAPDLVNRAAEAILSAEDELHGGFGQTPKFPQAPVLGFLLRHARSSGDPATRDAAVRALRAIVRGGIYDQAGGGIMRYATDAAWLVPHFEKMLYDSAGLLANLGDAYAITGDDEFAHAARQTAEFLRRDMGAVGGGFASALSAETRGVEGATYTWLHEDLAEALTSDELALAERHLGVSDAGVWHGLNILTRREGRSTEADAVDALLGRILEVRGARPQPERDTKVLTSHNAAAATGLMRAGAAIGDARMRDEGVALTRLLLGRADTGGGGGAAPELEHVLDDASVAHVRLAEDYAQLAAACLEAHLADPEGGFLAAATRLHSATAARFLADGAVFATATDSELPFRPLDERDAPSSSASSTFAANGLRLAALTGDGGPRSDAADVLARRVRQAETTPALAAGALAAMIDLLTDEGPR